MTIKLTKNGNPILVNSQNVTNYETTQSQNRVLTKLFLVGGQYLIVEESLEEIYNILWNMKKGEKQEVDWTYMSIDEGFEQSYQQRPRRRVYGYSPMDNHYR
jgi:uncharacterized protein YlzI (FlbEa/FlbD family)